MPTLSVTIITKNEAHDIRQTLESVKWADEIIILDSGSTDGTQAICREFTPHVYDTDWPGFGRQKNRAVAKATGDWVLSIDADERVSVELANEIKSAINASEFSGFKIPRVSTYCGKLIKHGTWRGEKKLLLFKRNRGKFTDDIVHERLVVEGKIGDLKSSLLHESYKNLEEVLEKVNRYSTYSAEIRLQKNKSGSLLKAILRGFWAFFRSYILYLGFLDGREGFMLAVSNAENTYYCYLKLMYLERKD